MKQYYECHVTMIGDDNEIRPLVEDCGWIFSCIANDICLGEGIKCYATMHYSFARHTVGQVIENVETVSTNLKSSGVNVIRTKVELVVYDSKQNMCKERN